MPRKKPTPPTEEEVEESLPPWPALALATGPKTLAAWLLEYFTTHSVLRFERFDPVGDPQYLKRGIGPRRLANGELGTEPILLSSEKPNREPRLLPSGERDPEDLATIEWHSELKVTSELVAIRVCRTDDGRIRVTREEGDRPVFVFRTEAQSEAATRLVVEYLDYDFSDALEIMEAAVMKVWNRVPAYRKRPRGAYIPDRWQKLRGWLDYRQKWQGHYKIGVLRENYCLIEQKGQLSPRALSDIEREYIEMGLYDPATRTLKPLDP